VEEEYDFDGVGVSFRQGEEVEIAVSYVEILHVLGRGREGKERGCYIDALVRNARWRCGIFLFCIKEQGHEFVNCRHGDVATVVAGKQSLALEVEEEDSRGHGMFGGTRSMICR
jgi:hypothetical protein